MRLALSDTAKADLVGIREYIRARNPAAAMKVAARIREKLALLRNNQHMGRPVEERTGVRELVIDNYVLPYVVEDGMIVVLHVWHGAQDR